MILPNPESALHTGRTAQIIWLIECLCGLTAPAGGDPRQPNARNIKPSGGQTREAMALTVWIVFATFGYLGRYLLDGLSARECLFGFL
jgi:hypothetical protein